MVQSCSRGEATAWATFLYPFFKYVYNILLANKMIAACLVSFGGPLVSKKVQTRISICVLVTNTVSSKCGQVGDGPAFRCSEKETNALHPFGNDGFVPPEKVCSKLPCCQIVRLHVHGLWDLSVLPPGTLDRHGVNSPKAIDYNMLHPTSYPFNLILSWILDAFLRGWEKSCTSS